MTQEKLSFGLQQFDQLVRNLSIASDSCAPSGIGTHDNAFLPFQAVIFFYLNQRAVVKSLQHFIVFSLLTFVVGRRNARSNRQKRKMAFLNEVINLCSA